MNSPVYLDNNATTPVDKRVVEAMLPVFSEHFGNPSSSSHTFGWYAEELVQIAREQTAKLINAEPEEICFTSGATESNNLVLLGSAETARTTQRGYLSARTEHRAVLDPMSQLHQSGLTTSLLAVNSDGSLNEVTVDAAYATKPLLASFMAANNEIGVIHDIAALTRKAVQYDVMFHTDATQAAGKIPIDVKKLRVDYLSFSAHKLYGPKGIGALYIKGGAAESRLAPFILGGGQENGLRSGTLNVPGIVGFGKACEIAHAEMSEDARRINSLALKLEELLQEHGIELRLNGSRDNRIPGNLNLYMPGADSTQLIGLVSSKIAVSSTSACSSASSEPSHVLAALGLSSEAQHQSIRIGIGRFSTEDDIAFAAETLADAAKKLLARR